MARIPPEALTGHTNFQLRRLIERLREGLYDPLAIRLLTAQREELDARLQQDLRHLEAGAAVQLCICGAYGQGKSHTLAYLREYALQRGYVVSGVNLDLREMPLHQFRHVYRALLQGLTFPAAHAGSVDPPAFIDAWQAWARAQPLAAEDQAATLAALLPSSMPHVFKAILVALVQPTLEVPGPQRAHARFRDYRPADVPWTLQRALLGEPLPTAQLRAAHKYRQVSFYRQGPLALRDNEPFLQMVLALPQLFRRMGYRGWVLLFDEGEAIAQLPRPVRARSYRILHRLLCPESPLPGLYPVFAFTPDFFQRLQEEDYYFPEFDRDYARAWRHLSVYQLRGLSRAAWQELCETLLALHASAYGWQAERERLLPTLTTRLGVLPLQDLRSTLKALVEELDQVHQETWFAQQLGNRP